MTDDVLGEWVRKYLPQFCSLRKEYFGLIDIHYSGATTDTDTLLTAAVTKLMDAYEPTTAKYLYVWSTEANDTDAITGDLRKVGILGIDSNERLCYEEIALAGLTLVKSANTYYKFIKMWGVSWGSGGNDAKGTVYVGYNVLDNPGFDSDTEWTKGGTDSIAGGKLVHAAGANECSQDLVAGAAEEDPNGLVYGLAFTFVLVTAGTMTPNISNVDGAGINATGTYNATITGGAGDNAVAFVGDAAVAYTLDDAVVAKAMTTIAAGANESGGSAIYLPEGCKFAFIETSLELTTGALTDDCVLSFRIINVDDSGADPDEVITLAWHLSGDGRLVDPGPKHIFEATDALDTATSFGCTVLTPYENGLVNTPTICFRSHLVVFKEAT